jgi:uncharacterized protein (DUF885 family)
MKRALKCLGIVVLTLLVIAGALAAHTWYAKPLAINWFYTRVFAQFALDNPELLTQLRMLEPAGIRGHNARWSDSSPEGETKQFKKLKASYDTLKSYDRAALVGKNNGQDVLSYDILDYFLGQQVRGEPWQFHNFPVNQLFGVQSEMTNLLTQTQQVNDATDAEHFIARLDAVPQKMAQVIEAMRFREARNIIPPKFVVEKVSVQIQEFVAQQGAANPIASAFEEKLSKIPAEKMDATARDNFAKRVEASVAQNVLPAYASLKTYIDSLKTKATKNEGAWSLPNGDAFYQYTVESQTTTTMNAAELHELGLREVARIGADMDRILSEAGYTQATRAERMLALAKSPAQLYPNDDAGREQILKDYQAIIDEIDKGLDTHFRSRPNAKVAVKRIPAYAEKTAPVAYYNAPALDGSQPGTFFANLRDLSELPRFGMRTLAYHEAIPGHHTQVATAQEIKGLPIFRTLVPFTAYAEGWALYAEQLGWEMGYQKNPLDNLGRLQAEMFRAVRLVVDTGIHAKRWSREEAIAYMMREAGMPEAEVVTEIERYFVMPGQALAYKVGMIKMLELRERAKQQLGSAFDIRDFHEVVLKNGSMPLALLERVVDDYVAAKKTNKS